MRLWTSEKNSGKAPTTGGDRLDLVRKIDFESLVKKNSARLYKLAFHMLGNAQEAEEAVQEIFLEAYRSSPGFMGKSKESTWLYSVGMHVLSDIATKKRKTLSIEDGRDIDPDEVGKSGASAEEEFLSAELNSDIRRAMLQLPPRYRAVFVLNVVEGYNHVEIAEILGISHGVARAIRVRAANKIRKILEG